MTTTLDAAMLTLGPELTIAHAETHRQTLLSALIQQPGGMALDLSSVNAMDSAGVQLLVALGNSLNARGQRLAIGDASATVHDVLQVYGLSSLLAT